MPVMSCPSCRAELDLDATDLGHRVECPACRKQFVAEVAPPVSPPTTPRVDPDEQVGRCDRCSREVAVLADDLGHNVECPWCRAVFIPPRRPESSRRKDNTKLPRYDDEEYETERWRRQRYDEDDEDDDSRSYLIKYAKRECEAPGTGLQVVGWLGIVCAPFQLLQLALPAAPGGQPGWFPYIIGSAVVYQVVMSILQIMGGGMMKQAKSWGLSLTACITALLSGPCFLGLIFGIMGIVKLSNRQVRRGFRMNASQYDQEA
jgi:DNA-directed RNA polymerase subunit RPC12/RpoP